MATSASRIDFDEAAAPATPGAAQVRLYAKSDGLLYSKDDAGTETLVSGGAGGGGAVINTIPILSPTSGVAVTYDVNNTSYADSSSLSFYTDFDVVDWTHFYIYCLGNSSASGQTITAQACHSGTSALSAGGNDLLIDNTFGFEVTGWIAIAASLTGVQRLSVLLKGSNSTVDLSYLKLGIMLKG